MMAPRKVTNTATEAEDNPFGMLIRSLAVGPSTAIEAQEARGQAELVASAQIPTEVDGTNNDGLRTLGFVLQDPDPSDPLFRTAQLPPGWRKKATDHSMWSKIVDEKGRDRFAVFYKASWYDRRAHMRIERRFGYSAYEEGSKPEYYSAVIMDGSRVVRVIGESRRDDYTSRDALNAKCKVWLDEHYPAWQDPFAYWD